MAEEKKSKKVRTFSSNRALVKKRRKHIVECAKTIFYEKGFRGTNMRELAKACGLTTGAIYHYLGSKDDILHLIVKQSADNALVLRQFYNKLGKLNMTEALKACIRKYFEITHDDGEIMIFYTREIRNFSKNDRDYLLDLQVKMTDFFKDLLIKGVNAGEFRFSASPLLIAHNILMLGQIYVSRRWLLRKYFTLEEYVKQQTDLIMNDIIADSKT